MSNLGFNPENVTTDIEPIMTLLVQANTPLTTSDIRNTLNTLDIIEAFDIVRAIVLDHITPEEVILNRGKSVIVGTGKKYRKDKNFANFWNDIAAEVEDALYIHITRTVELSTGTKESTHPMIRRIMKLVIAPVLLEFSKHTPEQILKILDPVHEGLDGQDIFGYMSRFMACGEVELHPENIFVARKTLQRKCSSHLPKLNRLVSIRNAAENVQQDKYE